MDLVPRIEVKIPNPIDVVVDIATDAYEGTTDFAGDVAGGVGNAISTALNPEYTKVEQVQVSQVQGGTVNRPVEDFSSLSDFAYAPFFSTRPKLLNSIANFLQSKESNRRPVITNHTNFNSFPTAYKTYEKNRQQKGVAIPHHQTMMNYPGQEFTEPILNGGKEFIEDVWDGINDWVYAIYNLLILGASGPITNLITFFLTALTDKTNFGLTFDTKWNVSEYIEDSLNYMLEAGWEVVMLNTRVVIADGSASFDAVDPPKHFTLNLFGLTLGFYFLPYIPIPIPDWIADSTFPTSNTWTYESGSGKTSSTVLEVLADFVILIGFLVFCYLVIQYAPSMIGPLINIALTVFRSYTASKKWNNLTELITT